MRTLNDQNNIRAILNLNCLKKIKTVVNDLINGYTILDISLMNLFKLKVTGG